MKRCGIILIAMMVAVSAMAATNVTSVNAVGFIRTTVPDGGWALLSLPFEQLDGSVTVTVSDVLPDAPVGTKAWLYRNGGWIGEGVSAFPPPGEWTPDTNELIRGDALFVKVPAGGGAVDLTVMGEVPGANQGMTNTTMIIDSGWTLLGFAYPADVYLTNTTLNVEASPGDKLWWWDTESQGWQAAGYSAFPPPAHWTPSDLMLKAGKGYYYSTSSGPVSWVQDKPYIWP